MTTPTPIGRYAPASTTTILPPIVRDQTELDVRGFGLPEGTITPNGVRVWAIKYNGDRPVAWVEAIGRDSIDALNKMIKGARARDN